MFSIAINRTFALRSAALECWPEGTVHTGDDVIINGRSLAQVGRTEATPAVRIGPVAHPWKARWASPRRSITVVLTRVEQITQPAGSRHPEVWVDAELHRCRPILTATRVIGREGSTRLERMQLHPAAADDPEWAHLPSDIRVGDLLVIPCDGTTPLSELRRRDHHPERVTHDRLEAAEEDPPFNGVCGR